MLALRFHRIATPVRYAMVDPAHEDAVRSYLRFMTRAYGAPQLHRMAQNVLQPVYHKGYLEGDRYGEGDQTSPLMPHLFERILGGDHMALTHYLDQMGEYSQRHGYELPSGVTDEGRRLPHSQLLTDLQEFHDNVSRGIHRGSGVRGVGGSIHRAFAPEALRSTDTVGLLRSLMRGHIDILGDAILHPQSGAPLTIGHRVEGLARRVYGQGETAALPDLHDILGTLQSHSEGTVNQLAAQARDTVGGHMSRFVVPHLFDNYG
jgi:hypothetical protein